MRVDAISERTFGRDADRVAQRQAPQASGPRAQSRALVAVEPPANREDRSLAYRDAPFLAQLLATKAKHPQTCARRRAEPGAALAAYRAVASLVRS